MTRVLSAICVLFLAAATASPQSLAEIAKKTEQERADREKAETQSKPGGDKKAGDKKADDKKPDAQKADAEKPATKVYTNRDLGKPVDAPERGAVPRSSSPRAPFSSAVPLRTDDEKQLATARRTLAPYLSQMNVDIHRWIAQGDFAASACSKGSYAGLSGNALEIHRSYCVKQVRDVNVKEARVKAQAKGIEDLARQKAILPGTVRELFKELGWDR